jgi:predicted aconitase with swiveling domain
MMAEVLLPALPTRDVAGEALHISDPISFWGGVSPEDGRLLEESNAAFGESVAGKVILIRELRGSSSASSVLLELIRRGAGPAAIILAEVDAILALGILVAQEMDWETPPLLQLRWQDQLAVGSGTLRVRSDGNIEVEAA